MVENFDEARPAFDLDLAGERKLKRTLLLVNGHDKSAECKLSTRLWDAGRNACAWVGVAGQVCRQSFHERRLFSGWLVVLWRQ